MSKDVLLIGECGHNWVPNFDSIAELIKMVKTCKWDIAKFQAYDTNKIKQPGDTNYNELKAAELSNMQLELINETCRYYDVEFMASAFDLDKFKFLDDMGMRRHKVASRCIHDKDLLDAMINTGKQVIVSTANWGGYALPEYKVDFLYCKSRRQILRDGFGGLPVFSKESYAGFSDHTIGNYWVKKAISDGAKIIEKHITFDKNKAGWDQCASAEMNDMIEIAKYCGR